MSADYPDIYVFDIDATLADNSHRVPHLYLEDGTRDWDTFFSLQLRDTPIPAMVDLLRIINRSYCTRVILLTGRDEEWRGVTEAWLDAHEIPYDELIMRPEGDRECDSTLKVRLLNENLTYAERAKVQTIFEDRKRVVEGLRAAGYHVCHVTEGDF